MKGGNGVDLGTVYQLLLEVAQVVRSHSDAFLRIDARLDGMNARLGGMDARLDGTDARLAGMDARLAGMDARLDGMDAGLDAQTEKLNELVAVVNDHTRKLDDLMAGLASLRDTVNDYHHAVVGHGIAITDVDERVRRIERHIEIEPPHR